MYVCLSVTLFCAFLKRSTNALRACVRVHVYLSVYVASSFSGVRLKFLFFREVSVSASRMRMNVYVSVCVLVYALYVCVCVYAIYVCVLVCARE